MHHLPRRQSQLPIILIASILFVASLVVFYLSSSRQPTPAVEIKQEPASDTKAADLERLSSDYKACIQQGDEGYNDALNKIPDGTDSTTRWNYIQSLQQIVDSHKANCDRIYQTEKDRISMEGEQ